MRRFILLTAALVVAAATVGATGKQVTVSNGSSTNVIPWWPTFFPDGARVQMLYDQAKINYAGTINEFELQKSDTASCTVSYVKFYLCHTKLAALTTNFKDNYAGNTPVGVAKFETYTVPARAGFYPIPMATSFPYNNKDNLILEIVYQKIKGSQCNLLYGQLPSHRLWAKGFTATTGTSDKVGYNGRISFSYYTALSPTSLGRVKSLFR